MPAPTPEMMKAIDGLFANPNSLSHSSFVSVPSWYKSMATFAPSGKPHMFPSRNGIKACSLIEKVLANVFVMNELLSKVRFLNRKSDKIINGKIEGIMDDKHIFMELLNECLMML
jgi:hypothetical protein